jgi:hypothetical protein
MGLVVYFFILGKTGLVTDASNKFKATLAILLLFALLDVYTGIWSQIKNYICRSNE